MNQAPVAWATQESLWRLNGGGNAKGAVPMHCRKSSVACHGLFTEDQLNQARADALREAAENVSVWLDLHSRERYLVRDGLRRMAEEIEGEKK